MNRVAVPHNSSYRDPPPSSLPHYPPVRMEQKSLNKQPSRLEMLQADYQSKLMREKEEKMIRMYEDQQRRALGKVNQRINSGSSSTSGVSAREFFQHRRTLEQQGYQSPPIQDHYRQVKRGYSSGGHSSSGFSSASSQGSRYGKNSAGKDRGNLLQPIDKRTPPVPTKARMARQRPAHVRNNANGGPRPQGNYDVRYDNSRTSSNESSPPPNLQTLRNFQRKRLGAPPPPRDENEGPQKLTDFQRWQMEQNKAREHRLERNRRSVEEHSPMRGQQWGDGDSSDGDKENREIQDEIEMKQRQLMEEIERQKQELETIQRQKEEEEEEARRQAEQDRRREAEREKRRKQQLAEERKRRMEEEEQERREAERERKEAERGRKEEERRREDERRRNEQQRRQQQQQRQQQRRAAARKPQTPPPEEEDYEPLPNSNDEFMRKLNQALMEEEQGGGSRLASCKVCGRSFAADRLAKHQSACKNLTKKRKVFDPTKMRTAGTEMAQYVGKASKTSSKPQKKKDWRAQHESFIETIRYAKKVSEMEAAGIKPSNLPPPPKSVNPDYVTCPKCNRSFNPTTAERHIPNCHAKRRR